MAHITNFAGINYKKPKNQNTRTRLSTSSNDSHSNIPPPGEGPILRDHPVPTPPPSLNSSGHLPSSSSLLRSSNGSNHSRFLENSAELSSSEGVGNEEIDQYKNDSHAVAEIRKYLRLPTDEEILHDQPCEWLGSFDSPTEHTKGNLFITQQHIVFLEKIPQYFPLKEGYVEKSTRKADGTLTGWKIRFLLLTSDNLVLFYNFKRRYEYRTCGILPFQDIYSVGITSDPESPFCFEMSTSRKLYVFSCESKQERDEWIDAIRERIEHQNIMSAYQTRKETIIPLMYVASIERIRGSIFPKVMRVTTDDKKEFLFSLTQRDRYWNVIMEAWRQGKNRTPTDRQEVAHEWDSPRSVVVAPIPEEEFEIKYPYKDPKSEAAQEFYNKLGFATTEFLVEKYHCTHSSKIPLTGYLYISRSYVSFCSTVPTQRHTVVIPWVDIVDIQKVHWRENWSLHAIKISTKSHSQVIFSHFARRQSAFEMLTECLGHLSKKGTLSGDIMMSPTPTEGRPSYDVSVPNWLPNGKGLRITVLLVGTRGDVQPFLALGLGLQRAGHKVKIATHEYHRKFVEERGFEFGKLAGDPKELIDFMVKNDNVFSVSFLREGLTKFAKFIDDLLQSCWEVCKEGDVDLLITNPPAFGGPHVAEKLKIPIMAAFTMPWSRTTEVPHPFAAQNLFGGPAYNYASYVAVEEGTFAPIRGTFNRFRTQTLGLPPLDVGSGHSILHNRRIPFMYCWSPLLLKKPADWGDHITITGYWFLDGGKYEPEEKLKKFLAEGKKPIYVGFGSVSVQDPEGLTKTIVKAFEETDQRWGDYKKDAEFPDNILCLDNVPHDWLFPQMAAVIHHGGAGTTAAGLRAGVPTLIVPFFGDQYFWAQKVAQLGVGVPAIEVRDLETQLVPAIRKMTTDEAMRERAKAMGEHIRRQDGVGRAVEFIHREIANNKMFSQQKEQLMREQEQREQLQREHKEEGSRLKRLFSASYSAKENASGNG
ncbi:hypothetical protein PROFUN_02530 [Planoprotostelium fungivorum]|uniref:sterol 3beta-glucosyltransferase n=1 Tax=Planoprotostelium fungivorum TaxID=1890364 RepID=A0A2P6MP89_9EUKA|nr:hypothetical protein PROFUN_02530 [Planoprotostelium fungivorum]